MVIVSRAKMILTPKNCCCFLSLKMGTLIIGILEIAAGVGYIIGGSVRVSKAGAFMCYLSSDVFICISGSAELTYLSPSMTTAVGALMIASGILLLLTAVVLLAGATMEKAALLLPWMVYMLTFIVTNSFLHIIASAQDIEAHFQSLGDANAVISVLVFLVQLYCLFVVYGLYTELKEPAAISHTTTQNTSRPWTTPA